MRDLDGYLDAMATQDLERGILDHLWDVMIEIHEIGSARGDNDEKIAASVQAMLKAYRTVRGKIH